MVGFIDKTVSSFTGSKYSQAYRDFQKETQGGGMKFGESRKITGQTFAPNFGATEEREALGVFRDDQGRILKQGGILNKRGKLDNRFVVDFEQESYRRLLEAQTKQAEYDANNPNRFIEEYRQILGANRDNDLALMNQRSANDLVSQEKMYERMGLLARQQAESWLNTNKQLADQSFGFRSRESAQQAAQEKDLQLSQIRENEGVESRRRSSERSAALGAYKNL